MADNGADSSALWASDREEPLTSGIEETGHQKTRSTAKEDKLNDKLNTDYVDVSAEDTSPLAKWTRATASFVGNLFTPRQMLIVLRVLKALTMSFLGMTIVADLMYIFFVEVFASSEVATKVGGTRDIIVRLYGLFLAIVALLIELEHKWIDRKFPGLKGFIPRSLLYFFISIVTGSNPLHESYLLQDKKEGDDDDTFDYDESVSSEIPGSTIVFQMVTSFVLGVCAIFYFILGVLCFDRFTSRAFLSKTDPLATTAIPPLNMSSVPAHLDDNGNGL